MGFLFLGPYMKCVINAASEFHGRLIAYAGGSGLFVFSNEVAAKAQQTAEVAQQVIEKQVQNYEVITKKYRIPLLTIDTLSPVDKQVRKALGGKR